MRNTNTSIKTNRKLCKSVLRLADNDEWEEVYHILTENPNLRDLGTFRTKETGDYLIHLAAYAACEKHEDESCQKYACDCLKIVLERDAVINTVKIARDGGNALHAALAAISSCYSLPQLLEEEDCEDKEHLKWLHNAKDAIKMLLTIGNIDPNAHIQNFSGIGPKENTVECNEDEDEVEFSYAREAIIDGWNPLVMCIVWIATLGGSKQYRSSSSASNQNLQPREQSPSIQDQIASIAVEIIFDLVNSGADANVSVGSGAWSAKDYAVSLACQLSAVEINTSTFKFSNQVSAKAEINNAWDVLDNILNISTCKANSDVEICNGSLSQSLFKASLTNKVDLFSSFVKEYNVEEVLKIIDTPIQTYSPLPKMIWKDYFPMNLLCTAAFSGSDKVLEYILSLESYHLTENAVISIVSAVFSEKIMFHFNYGVDDIDRKKRQNAICKEIIAHLKDEIKQVILDKLVYLSCFSSWGSSFAVATFVEIGGDPCGEEMRHSVEGRFTPLHMVAGRMRGTEATSSATCLIQAGANIVSKDADGRTPLQTAIRFENYRMIQLLYSKYDEKMKHHYLTLHDIVEIGKAALRRVDLQMLTESVNRLRAIYQSSSTDDKCFISDQLGKFLLLATNSKSIIGTCHNLQDVLVLQNITSLLIGKDEIITNMLCRDEVGFSVLHYLLKERIHGAEIRKDILPIVLAAVHSYESKNGDEGSLINSACDSKIGGFTPLHMAYFVGCNHSVELLLGYGADQEKLDVGGRMPASLYKNKEEDLDAIDETDDEDEWSDVESIER